METLDENLLVKKEAAPLTDLEIFTKIWISPRLVFNFLHHYKYDKYVNVLLLLAGITKAFDRASSKGFGDNFSLLAIIGLCIVMGGLLGWITYYIYAALLSWTGEWLNGKGDTPSLLRVLSYGAIPSIVSMALLIPEIILYGNGLFQSEFDPTGNGTVSAVAFFTMAFVEITLAIWSIVLIVIGVSVAQEISVGKSILNLILALLVVVLPIAIIAILFSYF